MTASVSTFHIDDFAGELIYPGDPRYDEARSLHNAMVDKKPAVFARCTRPEDVVAAIALARRENLPFSIRGGGHAITGSALTDGGVTADMRGMQGLTVDPETRIVRAEAGLSWGEFDAGAWEHQLAVTGGRVPTTGIVGLALGSGSGWLERKFGYTCDNLVKVELVTADGRQVVASEDENPELFWGLRGGGGNFGVVTAMHLQLHELPPQILAGRLLHRVDDDKDIITFFRDFMESAPDEVGAGLAYLCAPDLPHVPEAMRRKPAIGIVCVYAGPPEDGKEAFRPLRELGHPVADTLKPMTYVEAQQLIVPGHPHGEYHFWEADFLRELSDETIDVFIEHASKPVSTRSQMLVIPGGGALARFPADTTAFGSHAAPWSMHFQSMWKDPADTEQNVTFTRAISAAIKPWTTGQAYLNYLSSEGAQRIEQALGPANYRRLQRLKAEWDPENFFCNNQNIAPAA